MSLFLYEMQVSADQRLLGTSSDHESIVIWDAKTLREIACVRPGFSGGQDRFAIDATANAIYSGTWEEGLTCYDFAGDKALWHRDDLIGIQAVVVSPAFPGSLFVALEAPDYRVDEPGVISGVVELRASTGATIWQTSVADEVYLHRERSLALLVSRGRRLLSIFDASRHLWGSTPMENFAVLDVAFQGDLIAVAEGEKGVRLMTKTGEVLFTHRPSHRDGNCIRITFVGEKPIVAVMDSWDATFITLLDTAGKIIHEYPRDLHSDICFMDNGTRFLSANGNVCRTEDSIVEAQLSTLSQA
jgi:hypothetical protein